MVKGTGRRDLKKEAFWQRMIGRHADSGLTVRAWCRRHGLSESSFHWWRSQLARRDAKERASSRKNFIPVRVTEDGVVSVDRTGTQALVESGGRIEIMLVDGRRIRVSGSVDRQVLADVLEILTSADSTELEVQAC